MATEEQVKIAEAQIEEYHKIKERLSYLRLVKDMWDKPPRDAVYVAPHAEEGITLGSVLESREAIAMVKLAIRREIVALEELLDEMDLQF